MSVIFAIVLLALKVALGAYIISAYRALQIQSSGEVAGVFIDLLLAPDARVHLVQTDAGELDRVTVARHISELHPHVVLRIWRPDGTLLVSTFANDTADMHDRHDLDVALAGGIVSTLKTGGAVQSDFPLAYPYLEIYAPIHDPLTGDVIAVGELYQDATGLLRARTLIEVTVVALVALAALVIFTMLAISLRQARLLEARLATERKLAAMNDHLRRQADQARLDGARANEEVLNLLGAELHDGPVQLLGLVSLMAQGHAGGLPDGTPAQDLIDRVTTELRTIATGLILPELEDLSTNAVIGLALDRHHALTGLEVATDIAVLDFDLAPSRKVCLFRVLQEGLSNAARHGDGSVPRLAVALKGQVITVTLRSGARPQTAADAPDTTGRLGLQGVRRRLDAFGGHATFIRDGRTVILHVTLPIAPPS